MKLLLITGLLLLLGKISGVVKDISLSYYIGISNISDAYFMAMNIATLANAPFLSAIPLLIVPAYTNFLYQKHHNRDRFLDTVVVTYAMSLIVTIFVWSNADNIVNFMFNDASVAVLNYTGGYIKIMAASFPISVAVLTLSSIQTVLNRVYLSYLLPLFNNVAFCITLSFFNTTSDFSLVIWSGFVSWLLLLLIAIISSSSILYSLKNLKLCIPSKKTYHEVFPFLIISSFEQLISVIPIIIAGAIGTGAISYLSYANKLNLLISSVALLLISTLIFPALTKHIVASSFVKMEAYCKKVFKLITLLTLGLAIPIFLWSESIVTLIYLRGEFLPRDVKVVTLLLQILIISLPFIVLKDYLIRLCISLDLKKYILRGMLFNILILVLGGLALANNIYYTALLVIVSSLLTTIYFILLVFFNKKISFFIELKYGLFLFIILMITGICIKLLSVAYFERYSIFLGGSLYLIVFGCLLFKNSHLIKSVLLSKLD